MRKGMVTLLCVAGLMLWGIGIASAGTLQWTLLTDASIAGATPTLQSSHWVVLPGAGGSDGCNFSTNKNCAAGPVPGTGSYSFSAIEYQKALGDQSTWNSCLDLSGGPYSGAPCVCAEPAGQACTDDSQCSSSGSCAGAGDCCPGPLWSCTECTDDPAGPDSFSFFGVDSTLGPAPNMDTCQDAGGNSFQITRYHVATSESIAGSGGACIKLTPGGPYTATPCGLGPISNGSLDVDVYIGGCAIKGTTIPNIQFTGEVYDVTNGSPSGTCGYTSGQISTLLGQASAAGGNYLMVMCGNTLIPPDSKTACLRNADVDFVVVAYTADDASSCPTDGCN